jgi:hypothetical protein
MSTDSGPGQRVIPTQWAKKVDPMEAGSRTRIYEILRRSRPLPLGMIRRLHERLHIPAEVLIRPETKGRDNRKLLDQSAIENHIGHPLPSVTACDNYHRQMTPLENYLRELRQIRSTGAGVEEESYYHPLAALFNELGKKLKPRVKCILQLANRGAGKPDGGLFTADQFEKLSDAEPLPGQLPARGAVEVKPAKDDAWVTAEAPQVTKYWNRYRQVLVTNYRDFVLVGQDFDGNSAILETYRLADNERAFWAPAASPRATAERQNDRFVEYLLRVMRHAAPVASPEDVAWFLASYARDALAGIRQVELSALAAVRAALEEALGLKFEGDKGEHFFRSSLVQTLFYGIFSAWVLWSRQNPPSSRKRFDWRLTAWSLHVPMISRLFSLIAEPRQLDALKLSEVLDWTGAVLNRVDRPSFFSSFQESHAVQYFYEPFLEAFDPELRKQLGVWYTPPEIVKYMVERVDTVLRQELGLPLGLADENVYVLDPCCGTGSYLVEVLDRIHRTLSESIENGLTSSDLKEAAQKRVFGFEILPAPFVVSHLQLGLLLQRLGVPLSDKGQERVAVYLTNSLTGWEPPKVPKSKLLFPELEEEREKAELVKREVPVLVILGNPPYNAFAGVSPAEELGMVEPYKEGLVSEWGIKKFNIDDLYVRFFRLAERRIVQGPPGRGIVCFISNFSYLSDPSFVVMRRKFLSEFNKLWIDCLNGDSRETGKLTPDGKPDPSVFSTDANPEGIRVGTAVSVLVKSGESVVSPTVLYRQFWGTTKRADLLHSLSGEDRRTAYAAASPAKSNRYSFRPSVALADYGKWPNPLDLCGEPPISGLQEMRKGALMDFDETTLNERLKQYLDPEIEFGDLDASGLRLDGGRFEARPARKKILQSRKKILQAEKREPGKIVRYGLYPLDSRWAYHTNVRPLWNEPRPALAAQAWPGNTFFVVRMFAERPHENAPAMVTTVLPDYHLLRPNAVAIPFRVNYDVRSDDGHHGRIHARADAPSGTRANLSPACRDYLRALGTEEPDASAEAASVIWLHALAICFSPAYLTENAQGIRQDWPRIPLPDSKELLLASAALGREIARLLDTEAPRGRVPVPFAGSGTAPSPLYRKIAVPMRVDGNPLDVNEDLAMTAGWGHAGKGGVTMPGKGRLIERGCTPEERELMLGDRTCDVYLNEVAYWKNIPIRVWEYTVGGYQVIKKWLSYREKKLLGRALTKGEVRWVQEMARRIAAILLMESALDDNYRAVKARTYEWPKQSA